ncbi:hypothetical protein QTP86_000434 [Hemibagrus guttatus]|nr:hypothetical protein QTP86_000434 [Hemibagrus guttatus]
MMSSSAVLGNPGDDRSDQEAFTRLGWTLTGNIRMGSLLSLTTMVCGNGIRGLKWCLGKECSATGTIESILSSCITAWFGNCTVSDRKTLQRIVRTAKKIIRVSLPSITDIYTNSIVDDPTHPSHFNLLPPGKR